MAGALQLLRSNDLIWSRIILDHLMGERTPTNDFWAWNADTSRMPYRKHSKYLRQLFLNNDLAEGRYQIGGDPVAISDIRAPVFLVGTERASMAPWETVFKFNLLLDTDVTFVLKSGGRNAGIASEPRHPNRHYRVRHKAKDNSDIDPDRWIQKTPSADGAWWPVSSDWAAEWSGGKRHHQRLT